MTLPGATGTPITLLTHPIRYEGKSPEVRLPPQMLGAQTADILGELGFSSTEIDTFEKNGVVAGTDPGNATT